MWIQPNKVFHWLRVDCRSLSISVHWCMCFAMYPLPFIDFELLFSFDYFTLVSIPSTSTNMFYSGSHLKAAAILNLNSSLDQKLASLPQIFARSEPSVSNLMLRHVKLFNLFVSSLGRRTNRLCWHYW